MTNETLERANEIRTKQDIIIASLKSIEDFLSNAHSVLSNMNTTNIDNKMIVSSSQMSMSIKCKTVLDSSPFAYGLKVPMSIDTILSVLENHKADLEHELLELDIEFKKL